MIKPEEIIETLSESNPEAVIFDGLNAALVGIAESRYVAVYSVRKIIKILMERDKMSEEEAWEFAEFNIMGLHAGDGTPVIVDLFEDP